MRHVRVLKWDWKMAGNKPKRKIRDSVFANLFQDKKYLLQLYQALHPEDKDTTEDGIADVTIKRVLTERDFNDLSFHKQTVLD